MLKWGKLHWGGSQLGPKGSGSVHSCYQWVKPMTLQPGHLGQPPPDPCRPPGPSQQHLPQLLVTRVGYSISGALLGHSSPWDAGSHLRV